MRIIVLSSYVCSSVLYQSVSWHQTFENHAQSRTKLQQQFDRWYQSATSHGVPALAEAKPAVRPAESFESPSPSTSNLPEGLTLTEIGRASCRERVCQYV